MGVCAKKVTPVQHNQERDKVLSVKHMRIVYLGTPEFCSTATQDIIGKTVTMSLQL
jgi:hypothetical protein